MGSEWYDFSKSNIVEFTEDDMKLNQEIFPDGNPTYNLGNMTDYRSSCEVCGKKEKNLGDFQKCGRCKLSYYCSRSCQKLDWKKHKLLCKPRRGSDGLVCKEIDKSLDVGNDVALMLRYG